MKTGLYGIENSNRLPDQHWTKNCFNSSFPASLAAYMLDHNKKAIYMCLDKGEKTAVLTSRKISISEAFNCEGLFAKDLWFLFETTYSPYKKYCYDKLDGIDLVIGKSPTDHLRAMEIKLTAFPDNTTAEKDKKEWGAEMVIRSATTMYCALGIYDSIRNERKSVRDIFENECSEISDWTNDFEVAHKFQSLASLLSDFEVRFYSFQKPVLMQVLWKTKGKSPFLEDDAFQVIFWSDFAFAKMMLEKCDFKKQSMSRPMRAVAKMIRALWELCKSDKINLGSIYREMAYENQTDKEFSIPGSEWRKKFVRNVDLSNFDLAKTILDQIIEKGYIQKLQPERRLDQTLYFTYKEN